MRSVTGWLKNRRGSVRAGLGLALAALVFVPALLWANAPAWWADRGVLKPGATADDYAAVNQGQVKNIAKQAYEEMKAKLLGGAGATLDAIWANPAPSTDDYRAINLGQLKNVAKPFYDRLIEAGLTSAYPWATSTAAADDYALANIGQVKNLFSFALAEVVVDPNDTDGDGLLDSWEMTHFGSLVQSGSGNADSDGLSNRTEFILGTNPTIANTSESSTSMGIVIHTPLE